MCARFGRVGRFCRGKGTISLIEEAGTGEGKFKNSYLFRKQIRRTLHKIKKRWENGDDYCPKKDASKSGRPPAIGLNSACDLLLKPIVLCWMGSGIEMDIVLETRQMQLTRPRKEEERVKLV